MLRVLLLVADPDLSSALVAGLAAVGHSPSPVDPAAASEALEFAESDVCIAEAAFAPVALSARRGRGLVVLAVRGMQLRLSGLDTPRGPIVLRLPCSLAPLSDALLMASEVGPEPAHARSQSVVCRRAWGRVGAAGMARPRVPAAPLEEARCRRIASPHPSGAASGPG